MKNKKRTGRPAGYSPKNPMIRLFRKRIEKAEEKKNAAVAELAMLKRAVKAYSKAMEKPIRRKRRAKRVLRKKHNTKAARIVSKKEIKVA